ncbi:MAG TPA: polyhydroxyalkanoate synthesis regulator DNA-binding domain-containing protein [Anaeromyxobacteraceae bacterium]|nr:polyhydroxyalkanoate synthesis regulator DNA-binding domain-containing protein [Anaeromyxobacteraceae bacterium]
MTEQTMAAEATAASREPKVIKRYTNRKLYDTVESRYVTLEEIADMVKAGAEVKILDNRTKEDLTSVTLAQIIFEEEKKTSKMSLRTLRDLIRHGGERAQQFVEDTQAEFRDKVEGLRHVAEQRVATLITKGQATGDRAKDLVSASQEAVGQFQRRVDERVRAAIEGIANLPDMRKEMQQILGRLEELEKRLKDLGR